MSRLLARWRRCADFLRREAQSGSRDDQFVLGLTGIRALAAMMVLMFHLFGISAPRVLSFAVGDWRFEYHFLLTCGWMGANVFFVLSGFLLSVPFIRHADLPVDATRSCRFVWRRARRVLPAYWVQLAILTAVLAFTVGMPGWQLLLSHVFFLQNFDRGYAEAINAAYWTLPTEFGFYLLLPLIAWLAQRLGRAGKAWSWPAIGIALVLFAIVYRYLMFLATAQQPVGVRVFSMLQLPGLLDNFAIGMLFAWGLVHAERSGYPLRGRAADALTVLGLGGMVMIMAIFAIIHETYWDGHPMLFVSYTFNAIFMGAFIAGTAGGGRVSRLLFGNPLAVALGIISYSLYLWHYPILFWSMKLLDRLGAQGDRLLWMLAVALPLSIAAATLSYWLVERRFMTSRRATDPPATPPA